MFEINAQRTNYSDSTVPSTGYVLGTYELDYNYIIDAIICDGKFVKYSEGKLSCYDLTNNEKLLWSEPYRVSFPLITMDNNKLVFIGGENNLDMSVYCLDATTGKLLWKNKDALGNFLTLGENKVFTFFGDTLYCLNLNTGNLNWKTLVDLPAINYNLTHARPDWKSQICYYKNKLYKGIKDTLFCFDTNSGKELWRRKISDDMWRTSDIAVNQDKLYIIRKGYETGFYYTCIDSLNGKIIWDIERSYGSNRFTLTDTNLLFYNGGLSITTLNGELVFGKDAWYNDPSGIDVIVFENKIYCNGFIYGDPTIHKLTSNPVFCDINGIVLDPQPTSYRISQITRLNKPESYTLEPNKSYDLIEGDYQLAWINWKGVVNGQYMLQSPYKIKLYNDYEFNEKINWVVTCDLTLNTAKTSSINSNVNISGKLLLNKNVVGDVPIKISYKVGNSYKEIELINLNTNTNGEYSVVWKPTITGNYTLFAVSSNYKYPASAKTSIEIVSENIVIPTQPSGDNGTSSSGIPSYPVESILFGLLIGIYFFYALKRKTV